ncbi:MAG: cell division protein FtsL [Bdellovibrio sp.]
MHFIKPLGSVLVIVGAMAAVAHLRTYERLLGYELWSLHREQRLASEEKKRLSIELAKLSRPQYVEGVAQRQFDLKKISQKQLIRLQPLPEVQAPLRLGDKLN